MMKLEKLEKWLDDWRLARIKELLDLQELLKEIGRADSQRTLNLVKEEPEDNMKQYYIPYEVCDAVTVRSFKVTPKYEVVEYQESGIDYSTSPYQYKTTTKKDVFSFIVVRGKEYKYSEKRYRLSIQVKDEIIKNNGFSLSDAGMLEGMGRDLEWIEARALKEMNYRREAIEQKVEKICGKELIEGKDIEDGILVKGSNQKIAHIYTIMAGGYNIQCLHTRILVKEVK